MGERRATSPKEKEARRRQIQEAALGHLERESYESVSMDGIARQVGLAKGTLYVYYRTKEALFLDLLVSELDSWFLGLESALDSPIHQNPVPEPDSEPDPSGDTVPPAAKKDPEAETAGGKVAKGPKALTRQLVGSVTGRQQLLRLLPLLHGVLEHNIGTEIALEFKLFLKQKMLSAGSALERRFRFLPQGEGVRLLLHFDAMLLGFLNLARPAPVIAELLAREDLALFRLDLETELSVALRRYLSAYLPRKKRKKELPT